MRRLGNPTRMDLAAIDISQSHIVREKPLTIFAKIGKAISRETVEFRPVALDPYVWYSVEEMIERMRL